MEGNWKHLQIINNNKVNLCLMVQGMHANSCRRCSKSPRSKRLKNSCSLARSSKNLEFFENWNCHMHLNFDGIASFGLLTIFSDEYGIYHNLKWYSFIIYKKICTTFHYITTQNNIGYILTLNLLKFLYGIIHLPFLEL